MKLGVFLPVSGRAAVPEVLTDAAQQAERLGFDSVWAAERRRRKICKRWPNR